MATISRFARRKARSPASWLRRHWIRSLPELAPSPRGFNARSCRATIFQSSEFDLPPDGTKNFSAPGDAPSYFSNETIPESDRVNHQATFDSQEVQESPSAPEVSQAATETEWRGRHATAYRFASHAHGRYYGHGG